MLGVWELWGHWAHHKGVAREDGSVEPERKERRPRASPPHGPAPDSPKRQGSDKSRQQTLKKARWENLGLGTLGT